MIVMNVEDKNEKDKNNMKCYNCGTLGHYANDLPYKGGKNNEKAKEVTETNAMVIKEVRW